MFLKILFHDFWSQERIIVKVYYISVLQKREKHPFQLSRQLSLNLENSVSNCIHCLGKKKREEKKEKKFQITYNFQLYIFYQQVTKN